MADASITLAAKSWIDGLNSGIGLGGAWKLQRLEKRSKLHFESSADSSSEVTATELPTRLRRFAKGLPWALLPAAIKYLHETMPYTGMIVNGVSFDGKYVALRTWWERDEGQIVDRGQTKEGTYTIFQDLIDKDHADDAEFDMGGSCSEKITAMYVWNAAEIPDVSNGGQGITKSVQAVSRVEDGTFSYAIITRQALTQDSGAKVVKDDAFETVTVHTWDNVYTDDSEYVDENGNSLPIPLPSNSGNGKVIEVTPAENQDCTFKITAQITESKSVTSAKSSSATLFDVSRQTVKRVEDSSDYSEVDEAKDGKIFSRKMERRPDGKIDLTEESKVEQSVDDAVWEKRKTLRSVRTSRTDRNQDATTAGNAKAEELKIGQSVRIEKTDGGLYNITHESVASESVGDLREECQKTAFLHTHSKTHNQKTEPASVAAPSAAGGVVKTVSVSRTEDGTYDVTSESRIEQSVDDAVWEKRKTLRSVRTSRTDRNQDATTAGNAKAEELKIGQSVRIEKTDGGLYNITHESVASESVGDLREECQKTAFLHTHSKTHNQKTEPASVAAPSAAGGVVKTVSVSRTEDGTYDVTSESRIEQSVDDAVWEKRKTLRSVRTSRTDRNQDATTAGNAKAEELKIGQSVRIEKTDGGLYNITHESVASESVGDLREECQKTAFLHTHSKTHNQKTDPGDVDASSVDDGTVHHKSKSCTEEGTWDIVDKTDTEIPQARASVTRRKTTSGVFVTTVSRSSSDSDSDIDGSYGDEVRVELTDGGRFNRTVTKVTPADMLTWEAEIDLEMLYQKTVYFKNATEEEYTDLISELTDEINGKVESWESGDRAPSAYAAEPNVSLEETGKFSGSVTITARWANGSAGQTGDANVIQFNYTYRDIGYGKYTKIAQGRGKTKLNEFLDGCGTTAESVSISFDPTTQMWHASFTERNEGK